MMAAGLARVPVTAFNDLLCAALRVANLVSLAYSWNRVQIFVCVGLNIDGLAIPVTNAVTGTRARPAAIMLYVILLL
jgi:hypothetical protein